MNTTARIQSCKDVGFWGGLRNVPRKAWVELSGEMQFNTVLTILTTSECKSGSPPEKLFFLVFFSPSLLREGQTHQVSIF